jgi:hypothetical protein
MLFGHVLGGDRPAIAEQERLALLLQQLVGLLEREVEAPLVDQLLAVLDPQRPRLGRDRVVDALAEIIVERLVRKTR